MEEVSREELQEKALAVIQEQKELLANEQFKAFLVRQKEIQDQIADLKTYLKKNMDESGINVIASANGPDDWNVKLTKAVSVKVDDLDKIPENYILEEELDTSNLVVRGGKIFEKKGNVDQVKNEISIGLPLPEGFKKVTTNRLSIKVDKKAI